MEVGPGLTRNFVFGKSSQNSPKPVGLLVFWSRIALLKVVGYYDLSVLSMSVMGFQNKVWLDVSSIQFFWDFWNF